MKHSPEPWKVGETCVAIPAVFSSDGTNRAAALFGYHSGGGEITDLPNGKEDAARIVECVNACAGIENPVEAIREAKGALEDYLYMGTNEITKAAIREKCRNALAKLKGQ